MRVVAVTLLLLGSFSCEGEAVLCYKCKGGEEACGYSQLEGMATVPCGGSCYVSKEADGITIDRDCNPHLAHGGCTEDSDRKTTCSCNQEKCNSVASLAPTLPLLALPALFHRLA